MAKLTTIKDKDGTTTLYPLTKTNAVSDSNGTSLDSLLSTINQNKQDTLTFDNIPTENSNNPVKSSGIYNFLLRKTEHYATYGFPTNASSFRFQVCEAGDFDKYDYEFVIHSNTLTAATTMYMRFGDASSDLDTDGGNTRIFVAYDNTNEGSGTASGYQSGSANYGLVYNRVANKTVWGNVKLEVKSAGAYWTALIGRTRAGEASYRIGFNAITASNVTHARFYLGSGNFNGSGGTISVYRTKKA